jgi:hypothetical protein
MIELINKPHLSEECFNGHHHPGKLVMGGGLRYPRAVGCAQVQGLHFAPALLQAPVRCVEDELLRLKSELGFASLDEAREFADLDRTMTRFYIPKEYTWAEIRKSPVKLGQRLTDAMLAIGM